MAKRQDNSMAEIFGGQGSGYPVSGAENERGQWFLGVAVVPTGNRSEIFRRIFATDMILIMTLPRG